MGCMFNSTTKSPKKLDDKKWIYCISTLQLSLRCFLCESCNIVTFGSVIISWWINENINACTSANNCCHANMSFQRLSTKWLSYSFMRDFFRSVKPLIFVLWAENGCEDIRGQVKSTKIQLTSYSFHSLAAILARYTKNS